MHENNENIGRNGDQQGVIRTKIQEKWVGGQNKDKREPCTRARRRCGGCSFYVERDSAARVELDVRTTATDDASPWAQVLRLIV